MLSEKECHGIKILVVEDLLPTQILIKNYFEALGCEGDYVDNGKQAIAKLKKNKYDLCLMDLEMPEMGGIEATKIIRREISKDLPIVALTGTATQDVLDQLHAIGMNDYCTKPIHIKELKEKIFRFGHSKP